MNAQNKGVPLYHPYIPGTPVHLENGGTGIGTEPGTPSLKSLAFNYLSNEKAVHYAVQNPVHHEKKCTTPSTEAGTLLETASRPAHSSSATENIRHLIETPTPEQIAHARRMVVTCPATGGKRHCWHCSRCGDAGRCKAWRSRRQDVEFFKRSGEPYSLYLVESGAVEVLQ